MLEPVRSELSRSKCFRPIVQSFPLLLLDDSVLVLVGQLDLGNKYLLKKMTAF